MRSLTLISCINYVSRCMKCSTWMGNNTQSDIYNHSTKKNMEENNLFRSYNYFKPGMYTQVMCSTLLYCYHFPPQIYSSVKPQWAFILIQNCWTFITFLSNNTSCVTVKSVSYIGLMSTIWKKSNFNLTISLIYLCSDSYNVVYLIW